MSKNFNHIAVQIRGDEVHSGTLDAALNISGVFESPITVISTNTALQRYAELIDLKKKSARHGFEIIQINGDDPKTLVDEANKIGADLLIVNANSNPQKIANLYDHPVLSITENFNPRPIKKIVMPLHDDTGTRQKIPVGADIASHFRATVYFLVVSSHNKEELTTVTAYAHQGVKYMNERKIEADFDSAIDQKVDVATVEYAIKSDADMIIIMNDRGTLFHASISEKMLKNCPIPIMVVEPKDTTVSFARL